MLLLLLTACPVPLHVVDDSETVPEDTADSGEDSAAEPVTDMSNYIGSRRFVADEHDFECDETVTDAGVELTEGSIYGHLTDLCPTCNHFYENEPTPTTLCGGYLMIGTAWRAVQLNDDGTASAFFILGYGEYYFVSTGDFTVAWTGRDLDFDYPLDLGGITYETTGFMTFPLQSE